MKLSVVWGFGGSVLATLVLGACSSQTPSVISLNAQDPSIELLSCRETPSSRLSVNPCNPAQPVGLLPVTDIEIQPRESSPTEYEAVVSGLLPICGYGTLEAIPVYQRENRSSFVIQMINYFPPYRLSCLPPPYPVEQVIPLGSLSQGRYRIRVNNKVETVWIR